MNWSARGIPWIPEPSTVNNKLKCREGFCDWRGLIKESPR